MSFPLSICFFLSLLFSDGFDEEYGLFPEENLSKEKRMKDTLVHINPETYAFDFPRVRVPLQFHFVADREGRNFVCDKDDSTIVSHDAYILHAPTFANNILNQLNNEKLNQALYDFEKEQSQDSRIRFYFPGGTDCKQFQFYVQKEKIRRNRQALNVVFRNKRKKDPFFSGAADGVGGNSIRLYNALYNYLQGNEVHGFKNNFWDLAKTFLHEYGHSRNLDHTFHCKNVCEGKGFMIEEECGGICKNHNGPPGLDCSAQSSDKNLIMSYSFERKYFSLCEMSIIWASFARHPRGYYEYYFEEGIRLPPLVFDSGDTIGWEKIRFYNRVLKLKNNTVLRLQNDLYMGPDAEIAIEKGSDFLTNGHAILNSTSREWRGIRLVKKDNFWEWLRGIFN